MPRSTASPGPQVSPRCSPDPIPMEHLRVSDAERQAVTDRLAEHFGQGRLDQAEFDERVGRAMNAKTLADLLGLFDDLPETGGSGNALATATAQASASAPRCCVARPYRRGRRDAGAVVVLVPWVWIGLLAVVLLFATGTIGHSRSGEDRWISGSPRPGAPGSA